MGQHFGAFAAAQRERQLGSQQTVFDADIVAASIAFEREVLLVARQLSQSTGKRGGGIALELGSENVHHGGSEDVHSEKA